MKTYLRLLAAEDQAVAAAEMALRTPPELCSDRELVANRLLLGEAKLAIRRTAIAQGKNVDPDAGPMDLPTMRRLRPYTYVLGGILREEEIRQADAGRSYRERRNGTNPARLMGTPARAGVLRADLERGSVVRSR